MGSFSIWHWLIVLAVVLILFGGGGKIPRLMGDVARGIKSFKSGLKEEDQEAETADAKRLETDKASKTSATTAHRDETTAKT